MLRLSKRSRYAGNVIEEVDYLANRLQASGKKIIRLNRGDPVAYFPTPRSTINAFIRALQQADTGYSYHAGIKELRTEISKRHKRLYNLNIDPDSITVTEGVSEAILFLNSIMIDEGDKAATFRPYYPLYLSALNLNGGRMVTADYLEDGSRVVDTDALRKKLRNGGKKMKYLIFANPSNPSGSVIERKELKELVGIANDHDLLVVSDEIYDEITFNGAKFTSITEVSDGVPTMLLGGASKDFDATGFRIGYVLITGPEKETAGIKDRFDKYTEMRLSSNTPAQYAFTAALQDVRGHEASISRMRKEIEKRANFACKLINESDYLNTAIPKGAFYAFPKVDFGSLKFRSDSELVIKLLQEEGVQLTAGYGFGSPDHIRIVTLAPQDILEQAVSKIDKFLKRHSR